MIFVNLTLISFLDTFADKDHVSPKLSHTNVQALNYLLRSEIFMSEDGQLRATPLILDFDPLSHTFHDVGQAIKAGSSRLARIDVSKLGFLVRRDLPPVLQPNLPKSFSSCTPTSTSSSGRCNNTYRRGGLISSIARGGDRQVWLWGRANSENSSDLHFGRRGWIKQKLQCS